MLKAQKILNVFLVLVLCWSLQSIATAQEKRPLTVTDIMKFREIKDTKLSDNGQWIAYTESPDRGNPSGHIKSTDGVNTIDIPLGKNPVISRDGQWVSFKISPTLLALETASKEEKKELKDGAVIINTTTAEKVSLENVKSVTFSGDSRYALVHFYKEKALEEDKKKEDKAAKNEEKKEPKRFLKKDMLGTKATLVELFTGKSLHFDNVQTAQFAEQGSYLAYVSANENGTDNKITVVNTSNVQSTTLDATVLASYPHIQWNKAGNILAFLKSSYEQKQNQREHQLFTYKTGTTKAQLIKAQQNDWFISHDNQLTWSQDGERLFFGQRPTKDVAESDTKIKTENDLYNIDKLVSGKGLQVWHGDDSRIKPHAAKEYKDDQSHTWLNVLHVKNNNVVSLADLSLSSANPTDNTKALLATDDQPYRKLMTWEGFFADLYHINLKTGNKTLVHEKLSNTTSAMVSPSGRYVTYYHDSAVWMFDLKKKLSTNLTKDLPVPFANELHDYPSAPPGYGIAGWLEGDNGVLVYDRYDIWLFTKTGKAKNLTQGDGRKREVIYRVIQTDEDQTFFDSKQDLLLSAYYDKKKNFGFYQLALGSGNLSKKLEANKKYQFVKKAKDSDTLFFTQEDMHEFPDIWVTNSQFDTPKKLTNTNPQINEFLWGSSELVEWRSTAGNDLQGVLIKPANYQEGKRYPVLVYYYRYFSQRLHEFNAMKVNHRPNFPFYHSNGYAVFLPDIKFDIGLPGPSATQALVPGVQKLIDMGVADPDAIGLHGHSWSGYQSAFAITQTDVFKAAVAGAPVANMTSAYSGIRLGSGLSRAFQYENGQSRIGGDLIDDLNLYIENSPVFFADRINTPLLIQFGDVDDAVPWQQGIEMYTIMRRLNKPVIMLQYEGEPHHLKKYPNKVDYTLKMKQFFDHHLKGAAAPQWMTEGVPYSEKETD